MELEQQVVSLELAKKLKELGVGYGGSHNLFYWCEFEVGKPELVYVADDREFVDKIGGAWERTAAFTLSELIENLGDRFKELEFQPKDGEKWWAEGGGYMEDGKSAIEAVGGYKVGLFGSNCKRLFNT